MKNVESGRGQNNPVQQDHRLRQTGGQPQASARSCAAFSLRFKLLSHARPSLCEGFKT